MDFNDVLMLKSTFGLTKHLIAVIYETITNIKNCFSQNNVGQPPQCRFYGGKRQQTRQQMFFIILWQILRLCHNVVNSELSS